MTAKHLIWVAAAYLVFSAPLDGQTPSLDYPQWRGPNRDGAAASFAEPKAWPQALTLRWKAEIGPGYPTPIVVGNRVFTFTRRQDNEVMMALDAATGKIVWQTEYPAPFTMNPAAKNHGFGPKSTPLYSNGKLYTLGISGIVSAFDAASGKRLWQKPAPSVQPLYGTAQSPIAEAGLVIVHVGGHDQGALTAFNADTGDIKWSWTGDGPGYGSPVVADLGGTRQIVTVTQANVVGVSAATGELLWRRPLPTRSSNNSQTPIIYGDTVIISNADTTVSEFKPTRRDNKWVLENVWQSPDVTMHMTNGVLVRDTLFGLSTKNSGQFFAIDAKTGKTLWLTEGREATNASIVKAGDLLFVLNDDGELIVARSSLKGFEPVQRYTVADSATWAQPAISGNRVFIKDLNSLSLWTLN